MIKSETVIRDQFFSDSVCWQSWLDVESALALAQGEIGIIPKSASKNISDNANISNIDINFLKDEITKTGTEVFSLTRAFSSICGDAGDYVHWGATTQNIVETGQLLVLKKYHIDLMQTISLVIGKLSLIAKNHSNTIMVGRTLSRHALPITYGFKVAGWIENFIELAEQIMEVEKRLFKMRFGGAVGAFHSFGNKGGQLTELLAKKLGLGLARVQNRTSTEQFLEYVTKLSMAGQLVKKITDEFYYLNTEGIDEFKEILSDTSVGSSTMPQKLNPKKLIELRSKSNKLRQQLGGVMAFDLPLNEGDQSSNNQVRDMLRMVCPLALNVLYDFIDVLRVIEPNKAKMLENVKSTEPFTSSESIQMELAEHMGRGKAHDLLNELAKEARNDSKKYLELLKKNKFVKETVPEKRLQTIVSAENNVGDCKKIAKDLAEVGSKFSKDIFKRYKNGLRF